MKRHLLSLFTVSIACLFAVGTSDTGSSSRSTSRPSKPAKRQASESEKLDVRVTSTIVKQVEGKHRYFFDIRNHDERVFDGNVKITLITHEGLNVGSDTYSVNRPLDPGTGTYFYKEIRTGPTRVHGANGVDRFTYEVSVGNVIVAKGSGAISNKFEAY